MEFLFSAAGQSAAGTKVIYYSTLPESLIFFVQTLRCEMMILLKNPKNASTRLSMNGKSRMVSTAPPFVLRFSKDERWVFQQNQIINMESLNFSVVDHD